MEKPLCRRAFLPCRATACGFLIRRAFRQRRGAKAPETHSTYLGRRHGGSTISGTTGGRRSLTAKLRGDLPLARDGVRVHRPRRGRAPRAEQGAARGSACRKWPTRRGSGACPGADSAACAGRAALSMSMAAQRDTTRECVRWVRPGTADLVVPVRNRDRLLAVLHCAAGPCLASTAPSCGRPSRCCSSATAWRVLLHPGMPSGVPTSWPRAASRPTCNSLICARDNPGSSVGQAAISPGSPFSRFVNRLRPAHASIRLR